MVLDIHHKSSQPGKRRLLLGNTGMSSVSLCGKADIAIALFQTAYHGKAAFYSLHGLFLDHSAFVHKEF